MAKTTKNNPVDRKRLKTLFVSLFSILLLTLIDQLIKHVVFNRLRPVGSFVLINKVLSLTYVENRGTMMGLFNLNATVMAIISFVVLAGLIVFVCLGKLKFGFPYVCIILIIAGGAGNIIDRIFRGFVIDYIEFLFVDFYVFNFADMLITCSCFLLVFYELYTVFAERKRQKNDG